MMLCGAPDAFGSCCQISSVRNGMNGCSRRIAVSSAVTSAPWIFAARLDVGAGALRSRALASSMYQSHSSSQMKW